MVLIFSRFYPTILMFVSEYVQVLHGCVWDEFSEYLLETRFLTLANHNTHPLRIIFSCSSRLDCPVSSKSSDYEPTLDKKKEQNETSIGLQFQNQRNANSRGQHPFNFFHIFTFICCDLHGKQIRKYRKLTKANILIDWKKYFLYMPNAIMP